MIVQYRDKKLLREVLSHLFFFDQKEWDTEQGSIQRIHRPPLLFTQGSELVPHLWQTIYKRHGRDHKKALGYLSGRINRLHGLKGKAATIPVGELPLYKAFGENVNAIEGLDGPSMHATDEALTIAALLARCSDVQTIQDYQNYLAVLPNGNVYGVMMGNVYAGAKLPHKAEYRTNLHDALYCSRPPANTTLMNPSRYHSALSNLYWKFAVPDPVKFAIEYFEHAYLGYEVIDPSWIHAPPKAELKRTAKGVVVDLAGGRAHASLVADKQASLDAVETFFEMIKPSEFGVTYRNLWHCLVPRIVNQTTYRTRLTNSSKSDDRVPTHLLLQAVELVKEKSVSLMDDYNTAARRAEITDRLVREHLPQYY